MFAEVAAPFFTLRAAQRAGRDRLVSIDLAAVGAHLKGQPLHHELSDRGARLVCSARTAPCYRLYALATDPPKPGLVRVDPGDPRAGSIEIEVWSLDAEGFGTFVAGIPAPLAIGRVALEDGRDVAGFLCEPVAVTGAEDITRFGGWRPFLASTASPTPPRRRPASRER
jgi:allophanate hydrolase